MYSSFSHLVETTLPAARNCGWEISAVRKGQDTSLGVD